MNLFGYIHLFLTFFALRTHKLYSLPIKYYTNETDCFESYPTLCETWPEDMKPGTKFFLFTKLNYINPEFLHKCGGKLALNSNFNSNHATEIFIHGSKDGTCSTGWMREMKDQLYQKRNSDVNVILVDWTWGSNGKRETAIKNVKMVGIQLAFVVNNILTQTKSTAIKFHITGHSLGSHIAGIAGKRIKNLKRITGLDPSSSPFKYFPSTEKLVSSDAEILDVIHTSAYDGGFGFKDSIGDFDFFPNGGKFQPPNTLLIESFKRKGDFNFASKLSDPETNSHVLSILYYLESITSRNCKFIGVECNNFEDFEKGLCSNEYVNCAIMGMDFESYRYTSGISHTYYLKTNNQSPFCDNSNVEFYGLCPAIYNQRFNKLSWLIKIK